MSSIRGKGNKTTEVSLKMAFVREGLKGWKLHSKDLPGTPDFYFPASKLVIFVDGCFWHGCPKCGHIPKTRSEFWKAKIPRSHAPAWERIGTYKPGMGYHGGPWEPECCKYRN